jgi:hypothetical protein
LGKVREGGRERERGERESERDMERKRERNVHEIKLGTDLFIGFI